MERIQMKNKEKIQKLNKIISNKNREQKIQNVESLETVHTHTHTHTHMFFK